MKLIFKQKAFSFLDSYDIFDENDQVVFTVKSRLCIGRHLQVYDTKGKLVGDLKQKIFALMPTFAITLQGVFAGYVKKQFSFFKPTYIIDYLDWMVAGNLFEWDYTITKETGEVIATISKQLFKLTDTYTIDVANEEDILPAVMLVLAIDAEKDQRED